MTDAPERIWAWDFMPSMQNEELRGGWVDKPDRREREYLRADIAAVRIAALEADLARARERVEALERAALNPAP